MSAPIPTALRQVPHGLSISWSDGQQGEVSWRRLRDACPCAVCRVERASPPPDLVLLAPGADQPCKATSLHAMGNYAYAIAFNDGHRSGIFPLPLLR
ncbi:MAG: DUF971 domain-containing protein, partial [Planctomycetaceae bacterium]